MADQLFSRRGSYSLHGDSFFQASNEAFEAASREMEKRADKAMKDFERDQIRMREENNKRFNEMVETEREKSKRFMARNEQDWDENSKMFQDMVLREWENSRAFLENSSRGGRNSRAFLENSHINSCNTNTTQRKRDMNSFAKPFEDLGRKDYSLATIPGTEEFREDKGKFEIFLDVSQYKPDELKVHVGEGVVSVEGKHQEKAEDGRVMVSRQFSRKYSLPLGALPELVVSHLTPSGKLCVSGPKEKKTTVSGGIHVPIKLE